MQPLTSPLKMKVVVSAGQVLIINAVESVIKLLFGVHKKLAIPVPVALINTLSSLHMFLSIPALTVGSPLIELKLYSL